MAEWGPLLVQLCGIIRRWQLGAQLACWGCKEIVALGRKNGGWINE